MDISSGQSKDSYHGCLVEDEGHEVETTETGAPSTTSAETWVLETKMLDQFNKVFENSTPVKTVLKKRKLKNPLGGKSQEESACNCYTINYPNIQGLY